jgi:hypothetical protein
MYKHLVHLLLLLTTLSLPLTTQAKNNSNLILVTIDGLRWQELFSGADEKLINHKKFVRDTDHLKERFWHDDKMQRRKLLMPFFWETIAKQGIVIGNRTMGSNMSIANNWHFSYPGYSEIFTGVADNSLNSNAKIANPQISFLEWLNRQPKYQDKVAAFGSWDVFPFILNTERSHLPVNAGFMPASGYPLSEDMLLLNALQKEIPSPWHNVRLDSFTYRFAKDYLLHKKPKVMAISFGETDDFAHDGNYDSYLSSAHQTDQFIADLWKTVQATPGYKNNTTILVTTDHGRGSNASDWQHHASTLAVKEYMKNLNKFPLGILGSEHIWFAAIGPKIPARGEVKTSVELKQKQIAATALTLLGKDPKIFNPVAGDKIGEIF